MKGIELFEHVFAEEIKEYGEFHPSEIEDIEGVTCHDEEVSWHDGWYIWYTVSFRYKGKKYSYERKEHSSDNVDDSEDDLTTFQEVVPYERIHIAIEGIISGIENQDYSTWEEIIEDLENLKTLPIGDR